MVDLGHRPAVAEASTIGGMKRYRGDSPSQRELERGEARRHRRQATPGTYTGHEAGVGSTAKATKRNKRSL